MNKITRVLTMSGIGLVAAVMMAGPVQASDSSAQPATKSAASQSDKAQQHRDREYVAGYFSSLRSCEREGRKGQWNRRWHSYDCDLVPFGLRSGLWRLEVERYFRSNGWSIGHRVSDHRISHRGNDHRKHDNHKNDSRGGKKNGRH